MRQTIKWYSMRWLLLMLLYLSFGSVYAQTRFNASDLENKTATIDEITIDISIGSGLTAPVYNSKYNSLRLYASNEMSISAPLGQTISEIEIYLASDAAERYTTFTPNVGDLTQEQKIGDETIIWTGNESEVTFTVGKKMIDSTLAGQIRISHIIVYTQSNPQSESLIYSYNHDDLTATVIGIDYYYILSSALVIPSMVKYDGKTYSVTEIRSGAFEGCSHLTSVEIPKSVTVIGDGAFGDCSRLTTINVALGNMNYYGENGVLYNKAKSIIICYPAGKTGSFSIPNSVTEIRSGAFYGCSGLTSVTIPSSVTEIGYASFADCSNLTSLNIPNSVTEIGEDAFDGCSNLESANFESLEHLCSLEFQNAYSNPLTFAHNLYINGKKITEITVPESITWIGPYAFSGCSSVLQMTLITEEPPTASFSSFSDEMYESTKLVAPETYFYDSSI